MLNQIVLHVCVRYYLDLTLRPLLDQALGGSAYSVNHSWDGMFPEARWTEVSRYIPYRWLTCASGGRVKCRCLVPRPWGGCICSWLKSLRFLQCNRPSRSRSHLNGHAARVTSTDWHTPGAIDMSLGKPDVHQGTLSRLVEPRQTSFMVRFHKSTQKRYT